MTKKILIKSRFVYIVLIIIALFTNRTLTAQYITTKGTLISSSKPLNLATITVFDTIQKQFLKASISDISGNWQLDLKIPGTYIFEFSHTGHQTRKMTTSLTKEGKDFGIIELLTLTKTNKDVTITAKKPMIEVRPGKTIVNVDASPSNAGATVMDVLEKSPGISIDKDGNISLKGKQGVVVMIDKRPTYLSAQDLTNMLRAMPAGQLEQIEIIAQPGSSFDAAGNSGIINLKMKKNKTKGTNGSVTAGLTQGFYLRNNQGFNINYKNNKINIFSSFSHDYNRRRKELGLTRLFVDPVTKNLLTRFNQDADQAQENNFTYAKFGLDYQADSTNVLGFVIEAGKSKGEENWLTNSDILNNNDQLISKSRNSQVTPRNNKNLSLNLNWRKNFSKTLTLYTDVDYVRYDNLRNQDLYTQFFDAQGTQNKPDDLLRGNLPSNIDIYIAKSDLEKTFINGNKLEAGFKTSFVNTKNDADYTVFQNGNWVKDPLRSNQFDYNENINAAYVSYAFKKGKKWEFNTGLRAENTISKGLQKVNDSSFTKNYTNIFPTIFGIYKINEKQNLSLSFGRRIQRPDYGSLNPFRFYLDQYTYELGNVFLQPHFSYNTEINYSMLGGALNHTVTYSFTNKAMTDILEQNEQTNETYMTKRNIANKKNVNYTLSFNKPINKWLTTGFSGETNYGMIKGNINGRNEEIKISNYMVSLNNQIKINKTLRAELSGFYRGKGNEDLIVINPVFVLNAGLSKTIMKGKATLKLSARDIFNTQKFNAVIKYGTVNTSITQWNDRQTIGLNFTYRFNKGIKFQAAKKKTDSNEEKSRVKS